MKKKAFSALYFLILAVVYIMAIPLLALLSRKSKHKESIPARFFLRQEKFPKDITLWIHACSYGEIASLRMLIDALLESGHKILLTTTTKTGHDLIKQTYGKRLHARYLPFDLFLDFMQIPKIKALLVTESELWLGLFMSAKKVGAKTMLINARISTHSQKRYERLKILYKNVFDNIDKVFVQSREDEARLISLGAKNTTIMGNLKIFTPIEAANPYRSARSDKIFLAASTHRCEEELILDAFLESNLENSSLIIAPRHPERFELVSKILQNKGCNFSKLSTKGRVIFDDNSKILLADKIGELKNLLCISQVTILGGAFVKAGGHNPLEPAYFNNAIITGEHFFNQRTLFNQIEHFYIAKDKCELKNLLQKDLLRAKIKKSTYNLEDLLKEIPC